MRVRISPRVQTYDWNDFMLLFKNRYQRFVDVVGFNLGWLKKPIACKINDMSQDKAKRIFEMICEMEREGGHPATNQVRLNIAYTAGLIDKNGIVKKA